MGRIFYKAIIMHHIKFMKMAMEEADKARLQGEVPVGALLTTADHEVICRAYNRTIGLSDPTAHAEIRVLREGGRILRNYRLLNTILYVTNEPCAMCMAAAIHARVQYVVFGAADPGWGACGSVYDFVSDEKFNHHPTVIGGVCEEQCRNLMVSFFRQKRKYITRKFDGLVKS